MRLERAYVEKKNMINHDVEQFIYYLDKICDDKNNNLKGSISNGYTYNVDEEKRVMYKKCNLAITKVIFKDPATIVIWNDKSKTVVKAQKGDNFDPEKGLAMAIVKRLTGNKSNFNNIFKTWIKKS